MKILIIEDHPKIRAWIKMFLEKKLYSVWEAVHWEEWLKELENADYDAIILDVNMPIMDWREFMKHLREKNQFIPVIALTSNWMLDDKIEMFDLWADDYVTKPFELKELLVRLEAVLKRRENRQENLIELWDLKIDTSKHKVFLNDEEIELARKPYLIFEFLLLNRWYTKNKTEILEHVWWESEENLNMDSITLESHIYSLRKKLGKDVIKTIKGFGYVIE